MGSLIITDKFRKRMISSVIADINSNTSNYYVALGKHTAWPNESSPPVETYSLEDSSLDVKTEIMFGKKVTSADVTYMVERHTWETNTVYAQYDHRDDQLISNTYFVVNSSNAVFKCIYNNEDQPSTVEPTSTANTIIELADGYMWKYMYQMSSANAVKFATTQYLPYDPDTNVISTAANGAIHLIVVENGGMGWTASTNGFVQQVVSNTVFRIDSDGALATNGYYTNSAVYIANGTAAGNLSIVTNYFSNSTGKYVTTQNALSLDLTSGFIISPQVYITGDGSNAKAYSEVSNGVITGIVVTSEGQNYSSANVTAYANSLYGNSASLMAIISPTGGHGSDPISELSVNHMAIAVTFANNETNTVPTEVTFRQASLLVDPLDDANSEIIWANTTFNQTLRFDISASGTFVNNEVVTGLTSNATAVIAFANSTHLITTERTGAFANAETIIGSNSAATATISNINTPDLQKLSGDIFYYTNLTPIQRSNTNNEAIKLIIQF